MAEEGIERGRQVPRASTGCDGSPCHLCQDLCLNLVAPECTLPPSCPEPFSAGLRPPFSKGLAWARGRAGRGREGTWEGELGRALASALANPRLLPNFLRHHQS